MANIIALVIAYVLGSLNSSILLTKYLKLPDPRTQGSGNAGATNILRTVGKNQALLVLIADAAKGLIAIWIARLIGVHGVMLGFVAFSVVVGHVFPVFFKFKGGKGVATALGAVLGLSLWAAAIAAMIWAAVAFFTKYVSLASMAAAAAAVVLVLVLGKVAYAFPVFCIAGLIVWKHKANIDRLRAGTENKLKF